MVELGMTLDNIHAVLDLDDALALSRDSQQLSESADRQGFGEPSVSELANLEVPDADSSFADLAEV